MVTVVNVIIRRCTCLPSCALRLRRGCGSAREVRRRRSLDVGKARLTLSVPGCLLGSRTYFRTQCLGRV